jgi:hypothetical protein
MIKNILCNIDGIGIYGLISIGIFFSFFTGMLLWSAVLKRNYLKHMAELPLNGGEKNSNETFNGEKL